MAEGAGAIGVAAAEQLQGSLRGQCLAVPICGSNAFSSGDNSGEGKRRLRLTHKPALFRNNTKETRPEASPRNTDAGGPGTLPVLASDQILSYSLQQRADPR